MSKRSKILVIVGLFVAFGVGLGAGSSTTHTTTTVTKTVQVNVPGPTKIITKTVTVTAPTPSQGSVLNTFHGTGNQVTPQFNVPANGSYIVTWTFSGNDDTSFGDTQPSNFSISNTGSGIGVDLPNTIASNGSGSTEVTNSSGTDSLNVQADGSWTIIIKST